MRCLVVLVLLLAACAPLPSDPYAQRYAADGAIAATQAAQYERSQVATLKAQQVISQIQASQTVVSLNATQTADALLAVNNAATSTRAAIQARSTNVAGTADALQHTQRAYDDYRATSAARTATVQAETNTANREAANAAFWSGFRKFTALAILAVVLIAGFVFAFQIPRIVDQWQDIQRQKNSWQHTPEGVIVFTNIGVLRLEDLGYYRPRNGGMLIDAQHSAALPRPKRTVRKPEETIETKVARFLLDCATASDWGSKTIPSRETMEAHNYPSNTWSTRVGVLVASGLAETAERAGTYITEDRTIFDIYHAIRRGQVTLTSPTPPKVEYHPPP